MPPQKSKRQSPPPPASSRILSWLWVTKILVVLRDSTNNSHHHHHHHHHHTTNTPCLATCKHTRRQEEPEERLSFWPQRVMSKSQDTGVASLLRPGMPGSQYAFGAFCTCAPLGLGLWPCTVSSSCGGEMGKFKVFCFCFEVTFLRWILWNRHVQGTNDRRKFRSQTSDNMDRWKAEVGRVREEKSRREKIREEKDWEERRCRCAKR